MLGKLLIWFSAASTAFAATINVSDYGASGDAVEITTTTAAGSTNISVAGATFSSVDLGKTAILFSVGALTSGGNAQDYIGTITGVSSGTNLTVSPAPGKSLSTQGTIGTDNTSAFRSAIAACSSSADIINIGAGRFLLLPPSRLTNSPSNPTPYSDSALIVSRGGITFQGQGPSSTALLGNGAWDLNGSDAYRGIMFQLLGPVTNPNNPLVFSGLTFDGGVTAGNTSNHSFPASPIDGSGWDITHAAVIDTGTAPLHTSKTFTNCVFTKWRGEILKSVVGNVDGQITITNCSFTDSNASAFNFSFTHDINGCTFSNLFMGMEFFEGYAAGPCYFRNSTLTSISNTSWVLVGALTNRQNPAYYIDNNTSILPQSGYHIQTSPCQNLWVRSNLMVGGASGIILGSAGYQGSTFNSNIVVQANTFTNAGFAVYVAGADNNAVYNVTITDNIAYLTTAFAYGYGWSTNVLFLRNSSFGSAPYALDSALLSGQWFKDDYSNNFLYRDEQDLTGGTNAISYVFGMRHKIQGSSTNAVWCADDTQPSKLFVGANFWVTNSGSTDPIKFYFSRANYPSGDAAQIAKGGPDLKLVWNGYKWTAGTNWVVINAASATASLIKTK